jgi:ABC-2 type transport system ATP-binding protein
MIHVEHLTKDYGDTRAVDDLTFTVPGGEVLGLVGPNGAGKTTTMRCICGVIGATKGRAIVGDADIAREPVKAKHQLAFIPDEPRLFEHLTVTEHLRFYARVFEVPDADARIEHLVRELELQEKLNVVPGALSRGMKQKVAIACGLLHKPRAILFDEPLTGLDPVAIRRIKGLIRQLAEDGAAVIISSHLLALVEEMTTRLLLLQRGRLVLHGTLDEIRASRPDLPGDIESIFMHATGYSEETPQ